MEEAALETLFKTDDLDTIVYRERAENIVPEGLKAGDTFDLRVATADRGALRSNNVQIGVTYFPAGPVLKGVQSIRAGQTLTFSRLPFKPGAELVIAMSDTTEVTVDAYRAGGAPPPSLSPQTDPIATGAKSIGPWVILGILVYALASKK